MSWLSAVAQAGPYIGGALSAIQSFQGSGKAQQGGEDLAAQYELQGRREARALRIAALRRRGVVRRGAAASGWDPNRGSIADVIAEDAYLDELDAQYAQYNANQRAQRARLEGKTAYTAGMYEGAGTILDLATRALRNTGPKPQPLSGSSIPITIRNPANIPSPGSGPFTYKLP